MMSMDFSQITNIILAIFAFGTLITAILTFRQTKKLIQLLGKHGSAGGW